jgi:hypothetical protein
MFRHYTPILRPTSILCPLGGCTMLSSYILWSHIPTLQWGNKFERRKRCAIASMCDTTDVNPWITVISFSSSDVCASHKLNTSLQYFLQSLLERLYGLSYFPLTRSFGATSSCTPHDTRDPSPPTTLYTLPNLTLQKYQVYTLQGLSTILNSIAVQKSSSILPREWWTSNNGCTGKC